MKLFKFAFSWQFWLSLILAFALIFGIGYFIFKWLDSYTRHGDEIDVPKISQLNIMQATKLLKEKDLDFEIDSFKYDPKFKSFQILKVYPLEGSKVKRGRKIYIRCNPKTWKPVALPNLIDKSKFLAFSQLEILGLKVGDTLYETHTAQDRIIRMLYKGKEIKGGDKVPKFSSIDLVIGLGLAKDVMVPDLIGLDYSSAKKLLKQNYFEEGLIEFVGPKDTANARIFYQDPTPGSKLDQGLSINLWLSTESSEAVAGKIQELNDLYNPKASMDSLSTLRQSVKMTDEIRSQINVSDAPKPKPKPSPATKPKSSGGSSGGSGGSGGGTSTPSNSQGNDIVE